MKFSRPWGILNLEIVKTLFPAAKFLIILLRFDPNGPGLVLCKSGRRQKYFTAPIFFYGFGFKLVLSFAAAAAAAAAWRWNEPRLAELEA